MKPAGIKTVDWLHYNVLFVMEHILGFRRYEKYFGANRKKLFSKIDKYLSGSNRGEILEVETVDNNITLEQFKEKCYKPVLPKVFRGAAKDWNAVKNWNLEFFKQQHGHKEIILTDNVGLADQEFETLNLAYYVNQIQNGSLKYLRFSDIVNEDENLKNDFDLKWLRQFTLPFSWAEDLKMFMGGAGTITPIHVGFSSFLFVQVMGRKKWIIHAPSERIFLDPRTERTFYFFSNANPKQRNDPAYPLLKYTKQYEVTLEPGDILWVPSFSWHYVENSTDSIGIRYSHSSVPVAWRSSKVLTTLLFMATKPNVLAHFITSRRKKHSPLFITRQSDLNKTVVDKINPLKKLADTKAD